MTTTRQYHLTDAQWEHGRTIFCTRCGRPIRNIVEVNGRPYGEVCAAYVTGKQYGRSIAQSTGAILPLKPKAKQRATKTFERILPASLPVYPRHFVGAPLSRGRHLPGLLTWLVVGLLAAPLWIALLLVYGAWLLLGTGVVLLCAGVIIFAARAGKWLLRIGLLAVLVILLMIAWGKL